MTNMYRVAVAVMLVISGMAMPTQALYKIFECGAVVRGYGTCDGELTTVDPFRTLPHLTTVYDRWSTSSPSQGFFEGVLTVTGAWVGAGIVYSPAVIRCVFQSGVPTCTAQDGAGVCPNAAACRTQAAVVIGTGFNTPPSGQPLDALKYRANFDACLYDSREPQYWRVQHTTTASNGLTCPAGNSDTDQVLVLSDLITATLSEAQAEAVSEALFAAMPLPLGTPSDVDLVAGSGLDLGAIEAQDELAFAPCIDLVAGLC